MPFHENNYLSWYIPRIRSNDGALNLHSSGMPALDLDALETPAGDAWSHVPALEEELSGWLGVPSGEVLFTAGATGGTLLGLLALSRPGAGALVERPIYEPMLRQAERLGPVHRLQRGPERGWRLDLAAAERLLAGGRSGDGADAGDIEVVLLTEPHNPSGRFAPREDVATLAEMASRHGAVVLVNEVYRGWSDRPSLHGLADNLLVVGSMSKLFGTYAARIGWLSGPAELLGRCREAVLSFGMPPGPSAAIGRAVLAGAGERVAEARRRAAAWATVDRWVEQTPGIHWLPPEGPGYGCVMLPAGTDDMALADRIHREGVLVIPGSLWEVPGALRLSWLQADDNALEQGLKIIGRVLADSATTG